MKDIIALYQKCAKSDSNFFSVSMRFLITKIFFNKKFLLHQNAKLKGLENIDATGLIQVGINPVGFIHKTDKTYLNIAGKLRIKGKYSIGRGCRIDIGKDAIVTIGEAGYINSNTYLIIMHKLDIGDNCVISWNCLFLDEDFHEISYLGKRKVENSITWVFRRDHASDFGQTVPL